MCAAGRVAGGGASPRVASGPAERVCRCAAFGLRRAAACCCCRYAFCAAACCCRSCACTADTQPLPRRASRGGDMGRAAVFAPRAGAPAHGAAAVARSASLRGRRWARGVAAAGRRSCGGNTWVARLRFCVFGLGPPAAGKPRPGAQLMTLVTFHHEHSTEQGLHHNYGRASATPRGLSSQHLAIGRLTS